MAGLAALIDQFTDFFGGPKLITGEQLKNFATHVYRSRSGVIARAGGGQANATVLNNGFSAVDTVATAADSVMLPYAIPGASVVVANTTANSMQVFGQPSNPNNGGVGDTIAIQGSNSQVATATGVPHASALMLTYVCLRMGQWKQGSLS